MKSIFASLAIWGCAIRIASHIAVASRVRATKEGKNFSALLPALLPPGTLPGSACPARLRYTALGKWGRTQMGWEGFNRILPDFDFSTLSGYALCL